MAEGKANVKKNVKTKKSSSKQGLTKKTSTPTVKKSVSKTKNTNQKNTGASRNVSKTNSKKETSLVSQSKPKAKQPNKKSTASSVTTVKKKVPSKTNKPEQSTQKKLPKKITSTQKIKGRKVSTKKQNSKKTTENVNSIAKLVKSVRIKISSCVIKIGASLKKGTNITFQKTKEISKKIVSNIKQVILKLQNKVEKKNSSKIEIKKTNSLKEQKEQEKKPVLKKNKIRKRLIRVSILCLVIAILLMLPYGITTYYSSASNKTLDVPRFVKLKEECCAYNAIFSTFRSTASLKKNLEEIISKYEQIKCEDKTYYYNPKENYTITNYGVRRGLFINEVYIDYGQGNSCDVNTKFKSLELLADDFSLQDARRDGNYVIDGDKIYNKESYKEFMTNVQNKIPSILRIVTTNTDGDVLITDLEYLSNGKYKVYYDGTRDRNSKNHNSIIAYKYDYLKESKNKLYAYNGEKLKIKKAKKYETYYLLTVPTD